MVLRNKLFSGDSLSQVLLHRRELLRNAVNEWNADHLLKAPEQDVIDSLLGQHGMQAPVMHRDRLEALESRDRAVPVPDIMGRRVDARETEIVFAVPCSGDMQVFRLQPDNSSIFMGGPAEQIVGSEIHVPWQGTPTTDPSAIKEQINRIFDQMENNLARARAQIEHHNKLVEETTRRLVMERKGKLLADRQLEAALGIPIRRKSGPPIYAVPVTRRVVGLDRSKTHSSIPFAPEPTLSSQDYEEVIKVLLHARNALERTPLTVAKLGEEDIRNVLLVSLNSTFEGRGGGELFNGEGKADIVIRVDDRNVFIGECKIWDGPKAVDEAVSQLLKYVVWRDSKAALLIFIRDGDATSLIKKTIEKIEAHANYKRTLPQREAKGRHDFVIRANDDQEREIQLAFLPFILPVKKAKKI